MGNQAKGILVPVDFTEAARHAVMNAIELAKQLNTDVYLVNFIPPVKKKRVRKAGADIEAISIDLSSSINLLRENEQRLADMLKEMDKADVTVHSEIKIDKLASGVKKQLKNKHIDLIVIGITEAHTVGDSFYKASKARDLIEVTCPIMVCNNHSHQFREHQKVVVSLDFDSLDQDNIFNLVEIAKKLSSKIHYIHVNDPADKKKWTTARIRAYLRKHNLSADAVRVIDSDHKEKAVRQYATDENADYIAISRFSKTSESERQYTEQVVKETESPVFVY
ncbi:UspA [Fulvivirga imtechensis AK7]|uniref:UspA n=1 Tax=Fulvivirga imtechensis AK7 TaxID=1237149 RepID=L8JLT6_9BACT|nr:universal stress protein [Fulvivirga imtechensis]ELR68347.1 UspA [Fulvivirga imtechensis AK7]